ncbi:MAG: asparagine synthase (glutamine-hydrolyzing) [Chloroflexi bacterium]|nr:asparagine synthase (glutamine-hydrolyzing) [Chloroflexota bacterium]
MCGIAGYSGTIVIPSERIERCLQLMHHRGPDNSAYRHWKNTAGRETYLLFTRLSIIDLDSRANQPIQVDAKWMVFNGELYNYLEIQREQKAKGHTFRTTSDSEVLLTAIADSGWQVLDKCEGMWAFAVYDETDGTLMLARDRFGEKPLYLYRDANGLYFGSEVKFIQALLSKRLDVNIDQVYRYMINGYKTLYKSKQTFFKGLIELPAGSVLKINADGWEASQKFWTPRIETDATMSYEQAVAGARERLIRSVELRLRADVPLAFCMSGGVDSNVLISIAKRVFNYDVHGFTIVNTDARYEEQDMVDCAVKELGIRHTAIPVNKHEFLSRLRALVRQHDAPVYTISYYAHWLLMQSIAAHGYRVSVSGTAADELFTGYYDHHLMYLAHVSNDSALHSSSLEAWNQHMRPLVRNPYLSNPNLFIENPSFRDHIFLDADAFARYLKQAWNEPFVETRYVDELLRNRMLNELFHESVPVILHEDDLNAMSFSIENRSPFLERALFEFCYSIPTRHLIRDGYAKAILRDAARGIAPDRIIDNHRKVGFNAPIFSFLDVHDENVKRDLLGDSPIFEHMRRDKIEDLIGKPTISESQSKFLFYFLNSKMFLEEFAA